MVVLVKIDKNGTLEQTFSFVYHIVCV